MEDGQAKSESELNECFHGLVAGLDSFNEVRRVYDEQVAFNFSATNFFRPDENTASDILAFFLSPDKNHGQKTAFLRIFLEQFGISCLELLDHPNMVRVEREDRTAEKRRIDISIIFGEGARGKCKYFVGIENKVGTAADLKAQLKDYVAEIQRRTESNNDRWTLFYLTPDGSPPAEHSMTKEEQKQWTENGNLQVISYSKHIIELFEKFEISCRAESVRAFLKDFKKYLKQRYLGETIMSGETDFITGYFRKYPKFLKHTTTLQKAANLLKSEHFSAFWMGVAKHLKDNGFVFDPERLTWETKQYKSSEINRAGNVTMFGDQSELDKLWIYYHDPSAPALIYIAISYKRKPDPSLEKKIARLEKCLKDTFETVFRPTGPHCAGLPLPHPDFDDGNTTCEFLEDKDGRKMQEGVFKTADKILKYIIETEKTWRDIEAESPSPVQQ